MKQISITPLILILALILPLHAFGDQDIPRPGLHRVWTEHRILGSRRSYRVYRIGHAWPDIYYTEELDEDDPLYGFPGSDLIWDFFSHFP